MESKRLRFWRTIFPLQLEHFSLSIWNIETNFIKIKNTFILFSFFSDSRRDLKINDFEKCVKFVLIERSED